MSTEKTTYLPCIENWRIKMRIANRDAYLSTCNQEEFRGANLFAVWVNKTTYVVYSYGEHWPLFVYDKRSGEWLENSDKYSPTTSKHRTQAHPRGDTKLVSFNEIVKFIEESK